MRKSLILVAALATSPAFAASFLNGGFEDGTLGSWENKGRDRTGVNNTTISASYVLAGTMTNQVSIVAAGATDPYIAALNPVYAGNYSVRVGDTVDGGYAGAIAQTVTNYTASTMNFSWAAVLEPNHGLQDSPVFKVSVTDLTTGSSVYSVSFQAYPGAPTQGLFQASGSYVYAPWQNVTINTVSGHDYRMELVAGDCSPTAHLGYAYLDGFGSVAGGGGDNGQTQTGDVPLPGTLALLGLGAALIGLRRKA